MFAEMDTVDKLVGVFQNPGLLLGIPLAIAGAAFLALGTQYQHRGVQKVEASSGHDAAAGLSGNQLKQLLRRPSWIIGTIMQGLAIICQLAALTQAPLIVVQPLGAIALVLTTLLNARISGHNPTRRSLTAIGSCVGGIFLFVGIAAIYAEDKPVSDQQLAIVLSILMVVMIALGGIWVLMRKRMGALFYVLCAGVIYGFVATLAKVIIKRIQAGQFEWLTIVCVIALLAGTAVGGYFVQTAHASGPPDLVVAGLTVIDPIVAVLIGLLVLGEASEAPTWAIVGFVVAALVAIWGVVELARTHPQIVSESRELNIERGSSGSVRPSNAPRPFDNGPLTQQPPQNSPPESSLPPHP